MYMECTWCYGLERACLWHALAREDRQVYKILHGQLETEKTLLSPRSFFHGYAKSSKSRAK